MNAPIALFLYNRLLHASETVKSLLKCKEAQHTVLYIFCDGPKQNATSNDMEAINKVRNFAHQVKGFRSIKITLHEKNLGLSQSIIWGINHVLEKYETVIVIEDDIVVSEQFLNFINSGLQKYKGNSSIAGITGYSFPFKINEPYFTRTGACWGWATYKNVWENFIKNRNVLDINSMDSKALDLFNVSDKIYEKIYYHNKKSMIQSWAIEFYLYYFLNAQYFLMPGKNLVANIGFDGTGEHQKNGNFLTDNNPIQLLNSFEFPTEISEKKIVRKKMISLYQNGAQQQNLFNRLKQKLKNFF